MRVVEERNPRLNGINMMINWDEEIADLVYDKKNELIIKELDKNPSLIDKFDECYMTVLMYACDYNNYALIKILVARGANINLIAADGESALSTLIEKKDLFSNKALIFLLKHGANPSLMWLDGRSILHLAIFRDDLLKMRILLKYGSNVNQQDSLLKEAPLHLAIRYKSSKVIKLLIDYRADLTLKSHSGTPLALLGVNFTEEFMSKLDSLD